MVIDFLFSSKRGAMTPNSAGDHTAEHAAPRTVIHCCSSIYTTKPHLAGRYMFVYDEQFSTYIVGLYMYGQFERRGNCPRMTDNCQTVHIMPSTVVRGGFAIFYSADITSSVHRVQLPRMLSNPISFFGVSLIRPVSLHNSLACGCDAKRLYFRYPRGILP